MIKTYELSNITLFSDTLLDVLTDDQKKFCPDERFLGRIISHVKSIQRLGARLGLTPAEIQDATREVPDSLVGQVYCMLWNWKENAEAKATVYKLLTALDDTDTPEHSYRNGVLDYFNDSDSD